MQRPREGKCPASSRPLTLTVSLHSALLVRFRCSSSCAQRVCLHVQFMVLHSFHDMENRTCIMNMRTTHIAHMPVRPPRGHGGPHKSTDPQPRLGGAACGIRDARVDAVLKAAAYTRRRVAVVRRLLLAPHASVLTMALALSVATNYRSHCVGYLRLRRL